MARSMATMLEAAADPTYTVAADAAEADLILLAETVEYKDWRYLAVLDAEPLLQERAEDCFAISYQPQPIGFLSGVYTGLRRADCNPARHRASCYLLPPDDAARHWEHARTGVEPGHLFSFRGARSHVLRTQLLAQAPEWRAWGPVTHVDRWFNHTRDEKDAYYQELLQSHFVLCPRGLAPSSHRIFETMQMGRVPVILADDWVPPSGPAWELCSLRIPERQLLAVPEILQVHAAEAPALGQAARAAWEQYFSPERKVLTAVQSIARLRVERAPEYSEQAALRAWRTAASYWRQGWTLPQRILRRTGRLWSGG